VTPSRSGWNAGANLVKTPILGTPAHPEPPLAVAKAHRFSFQFVIAACLGFLLLTAIAMVTYHGGTLLNHGEAHYSFFGNFFSDLGRDRTYEGRPNSIPQALFEIALTAIGFAQIVFFLAFSRLFPASGFRLLLRTFGTFAGLLSGLSFMAIAVTPIDVDLKWHLFWVFSAFRWVFVAVLIYGLLIPGERSFGRRYCALLFSLCALLGGYVALLSFGPLPYSPTGLLIQVVGQKMIVYSCVTGTALQAYGALSYLRRRENLDLTPELATGKFRRS